MIIFISIFFILYIMFFTSKLKITIKNCQKDKLNFKIKFNINIGIYVFGIVKICEISLDEKCIKILCFNIPYQKLDLKKMNMKNTDFKKIKKSFSKLNLKIDKFNFDLNIGCEEIAVVTFLTFLISSLFSLVLCKFGNFKNCYYKINPVYNANLLEFKLQSVISVRLINIVILAVNIRKNKSKKKMSLSMKKFISA